MTDEEWDTIRTEIWTKIKKYCDDNNINPILLTIGYYRDSIPEFDNIKKTKTYLSLNTMIVSILPRGVNLFYKGIQYESTINAFDLELLLLQNSNCVICYEPVEECIYCPVCKKCLCYECFGKIDKCPICRTSFNDSLERCEKLENYFDEEDIKTLDITKIKDSTIQNVNTEGEYIIFAVITYENKKYFAGTNVNDIFIRYIDKTYIFRYENFEEEIKKIVN